MQKQITPRELGIVGLKYITDLITRLKIGANISIDDIILSLLFDNGYSNIVVCISFDTYTTRVLRR
jgi:hypothetical protein